MADAVILKKLCQVEWDEYGWLHRPREGAESSGLPVSPDILIVFVHGFMSRGSAWQPFPGELLNSWGLDVTYYQYHYPSWPYQNADVTKAATALRDRLSIAYGDYAHIIIITHSTGALVLKEMLLTESKEFEDGLKQDPKAERKGIAARIRVVINLAGAHYGGMTFAPVLLGIYNWTWAPFAKLLGKVVPQYGYYKMGQQLMPLEKNPWLTDLNTGFTEFMMRKATYLAPLHVTYDINAENEAVVRKYAPDQPLNVEFASGRGFHRANIGNAARFRYEVGRAVHFVASILRMFGADMPTFLVPQIGAWRERSQFCNLAWSVAFDQLRTANTMDSAEGVGDLVSDPHATLDQQRLYEHLLARIARRIHATIIVSGPGGVGKSTLLRAVTRKIARDWLSDAAGVNELSRPMPLNINLKRVRLDNAARDAYLKSKTPVELWHAILAAWLGVAESFRDKYPAGLRDKKNARPTLTVEWFESLLANAPVVIVFDSVDEFLNGHADLTLEDIAALCRHLTETDTPDSNPRTVILAISHGEHNIWNVGALEAETFMLPRLSPEKTRELIVEGGRGPSTQAEILKILDGMQETALDAIALPLIIFALPNLASVDPRRRKSSTDLLELALERIVSTSRGGREPANGHSTTEWSSATLEQRIDMLTVLAWAFASDPRGPYMPLNRTEIENYLKQGEQTWFSVGLGQQNGFIVQRLLDAYRFLKKEDNLSACLRSTVFENYGGFQFDHKQWVDLCIGRFVHLCFACRNYKPLSARALHPTIYERTSDYMLRQAAFGGPSSVARSAIDAMLDLISAEAPEKSQFVIGNLAATLNRGPIPIDSDALGVIVKRLNELPDLARHVMLASLAFRAADGLADDPSARAIRNVLFPDCLNKLAANSEAFAVNPATASLAWCYSRLIERRCNFPAASRQSWPALRPEHFTLIARMAFPRGEAYVKSLLFGYLQSVELVATSHGRDRAITAVHYLLFAAIGTRAHLPAGDGFGKLAVMFGRSVADEPELGKFFREYTEVPEVHELYSLSRRIYFSDAWKDVTAGD